MKHVFASIGASQVMLVVKNSSAMQKTWVGSLGAENLLKEGMAILVWRTPWTEKTVGLLSIYSQSQT